jgi:hypothetical protein
MSFDTGFRKQVSRNEIRPSRNFLQYTIYPWMGTVFEVSEDQVEARQTASRLKRLAASARHMGYQLTPLTA